MRFILALSILTLSVYSFGCNSSSTAYGTVTLNGTTIQTGEVMFHPVAQGAVGIGTVSNGSFEVMTGSEETIAAGSYKVTVTALEQPDPARLNEMSKEGIEYTPKRLTPDSYADPKTTPLTAEVKAGANKFEFDVKSP